jgi:hypothetical protein
VGAARRFADMTATLVRRAVVGLATAPNLKNYGFMITKTIGRDPLRASGICFLCPHDVLDAERRYSGIADSINGARAGNAKAYARPSRSASRF